MSIIPFPAAGAPAGDPPKILKRLVLYVPGFIAHGAGHHHRLFAREAQRFAKLWGVGVSVSDVARVDGFEHGATWTMSSQIGEGRVETEVEALCWDDLVTAELGSSLLAKVTLGLAALWDGIASGTLKRVASAAPYFAGVWLYPFFCLLVCAMLGAAVGIAIAETSSMIGVFGGVVIAVGGGFLALEALRRTGLFAVHLLDDWIAQRRYLRREDAALNARLETFAGRLATRVKVGGFDEVLVVGHSSGSFLAIDVVARALKRHPTLGRRGPALSLLTVGSAELLVALHPRGGWMRKRIAQLAEDHSVFWAEVAGGFDMLNFPGRDPVEELGLDVSDDRPNPRFRKVKLDEMVDPERFPWFRRPWHIMRLHFQFLMGNDRKATYDFFSLICGARSMRAQFDRPAGQAMAPFGPSPAFARVRRVV